MRDLGGRGEPSGRDGPIPRNQPRARSRRPRARLSVPSFVVAATREPADRRSARRPDACPTARRGAQRPLASEHRRQPRPPADGRGFTERRRSPAGFAGAAPASAHVERGEPERRRHDGCAEARPGKPRPKRRAAPAVRRPVDGTSAHRGLRPVPAGARHPERAVEPGLCSPRAARRARRHEYRALPETDERPLLPRRRGTQARGSLRRLPVLHAVLESNCDCRNALSRRAEREVRGVRTGCDDCPFGVHLPAQECGCVVELGVP
jgi:hypothetical protein